MLFCLDLERYLLTKFLGSGILRIGGGFGGGGMDLGLGFGREIFFRTGGVGALN